MFHDPIYRLRSLFRRRAAEAELHEELAFHLECETEKLVRSRWKASTSWRKRAAARG